MAMTGMIVTVIAVFAFVKLSEDRPTLVEELQQSGSPGRVINIVHASWGLNCNHVLTIKRQDNQRRGLPTDKLTDMKRDNVLTVVQELCDDRSTCHFTATPSRLKNSRYPRCAKTLEVSYRCFSYDRLRSITVRDGDKVEIDCRNV